METWRTAASAITKRATGRRRALVPTMGALHRGHAELIRVARKAAGKDGEVAVSIFVNPLQFAPGGDYEKYPRPEEVDDEFCRAEGVDILFRDRKSTRLNSSHGYISYAVFCLTK